MTDTVIGKLAQLQVNTEIITNEGCHYKIVMLFDSYLETFCQGLLVMKDDLSCSSRYDLAHVYLPRHIFKDVQEEFVDQFTIIEGSSDE